ncbi:MAG: hypothetical protein RJA22_1294 [Verrucomicrobiota bacterium]
MTSILQPGRRHPSIRTLALWAGVAGLLAAGAGQTLAQPANDNFTNAAVVSGFSGSVSGSTVGATAETGEPVHAAVGGRLAVWFSWVAPTNGIVSFDTIGSIYDTVLAAYQGSNLNSLALLDSNDDFPGLGLQSLVSWFATAGTEYRVAVDGFGGATGPFTLNWFMDGAPTNPPPIILTNELQFSFAAFQAGENTPGYATIGVSFGGGAAGTVSVDYSTSDGTAEDGLHYIGRSGRLFFQFGESNKTFTVPILDDASANPNRTVNLSLSNPLGGAVLGAVSNAVLTIVDDETPPAINLSGRLEFALNFFGCTEFETQPFPGGSSAFSERHNISGALVTVNRLGGSVGRILVDYATVDDPLFGGAVPGLDYQSVSGTLVFDHLQTSTNFVVPVFSDFVVNGDKFFQVSLSNPRAADGENPAIILPALGVTSTGTVAIIELTTPPAANPTFTFERSNYRGDEYRGRIGVEILCPRNNVGAAQVDLVLPRVFGSFNTAQFVLMAGSDNADLVVPTVWPNPAYSDGSTVITNFSDTEPTLAGTTGQGCTVQVNGPQTIRVTFGGGVTRATVFIPVVDDNVVEFNEDVQLQLRAIPGQFGVNGAGSVATMTILYDDQPAGMGDRGWNPDFAFRPEDNSQTLDPPFDRTPGANNTVNAVAVDESGRSVVGGDFTAYNSVPRNGITRILTNGLIDASFTPGTGVDGFISDLAIYGPTVSNAAVRGKIVIVGAFSSFNGVQRNGIARLNTNGTLDTTFTPGAGVAGVVRSLALQSDGKILIAGDFTHFNGVERRNVARLNEDGSLDPSFDAGAGPNGTVWSVALLETSPPILTGGGTFGGEAEDINVVDTGGRQGVITVNYNFYFIEDEMRIYYDGRLLTNTTYVPGSGSFSINFGPGQSTVVTIVMNEGSGLFGTVWDYSASIVTLGEDKKIMIGGDFDSVAGVGIRRVARLNPSGSLDLGFNPGGGVDGPVYSVAIQGDNRVMVGGAFNTVDFRPRNSIARFLSDGTLDTDFNPGSGFDDAVFSVLLTADGKALCGGPFTSFDGVRRIGMARLFNHGALDTSFMDTAYNQFAGLVRGLSTEPRSFVNDFALQADGNIIVGGSFTNLGCTHSLVINETNVLVTPDNPEPIFGRFGEIVTWTRQDKRTRHNVARIIGGRTPGPGNAQFTFAEYRRDENGQQLEVTLSRIDGRLGTLRGDVATTNRLAIAGDDYPVTKETMTWPEFGYNAPYSIGSVEVQYFTLPITDDTLIEGNELLDLGLTGPAAELTLGGEFIPLGGSRSRALVPVTIVDNDFNKGTIAFSHATYKVTENGTNAVITLIRTNGTDGPVTVDYLLVSGSAVGGVDFVTNNSVRTVFFGQGVSNATIQVPIINDVLVEIDEFFTVTLTNATGGARLGAGTPTSTAAATVTIIDNDFAGGRLNFAVSDYVTNETAGFAVIGVTRSGGSTGPLSIQAAATGGTATPGFDFIPITNTLQWVSGDASTKTFLVPLLTDEFVEAPETVQLRLFNPSVSNSLGGASTAVLTLLSADAYGSFTFSQPVYDANENGTNATITVSRVGGVAGVVTCAYEVRNGTAANGVDYLGVDGVLVFGPGEVSKTFTVTLLNNSLADGDRTVVLRLTNFTSATAGPITVATLRIVDDESFNTPAGLLDTTFDALAGADNAVYALGLQPDGRLLLGGDFRAVNRVSRNRLARLLPSGLLDPTFNAGLGPNRPVRAMQLQPDGRLLIGGFFDQVQGTNRNHVARLLADGSVDLFFNPGAGANNPVYAMALFPDGRIALGGEFTAFNGVTRPYVVVLNTNGSLHLPFNPGAGADAPVFAIAIQPDGKMLIGGAFTNVGGIHRPRLARLNPDGSLDTAFNPGLGPNDTVRSIALQPDGSILAGGSFTLVNGSPWNRIVRLTPSGMVDASFLGGQAGANGSVLDIKLQADNKIIVVGDFTAFNSVTRRRITRLDQTGRTDASINFGAGADSFIAAAVIQPDRKIVIGGGFTEVQGQPRQRVARIHGGSVAGPGTLRFSQPVYVAGEQSQSATIVVSRDGGTTGDVSVNVATSSQSAVAPEDFVDVSLSLVFPEGEVEQAFTIPLVDDTQIEGDETVGLALASPTQGATLGTIPEATLVIQSDDSALAFLQSTFTVNENDVAGYAAITVLRTGSTNGSVSVDYLTRPGTATPDTSTSADYTNVTDTLTFAPGETVQMFFVPIVNDPLPEPVETVQLFLTNITGTAQLGLSSATLLLQDDDFSPGQLQFAATSFEVNEFETNAVITVVRTNGSTGLVTVRATTTAGTARPGEDYVSVVTTLAFADGETVKTFNVPIVPDYLAESSETVLLILDSPGNGADLGQASSATLTILNSHLINGAFNLSATNYSVVEGSLVARVTVFRNFGSTGAVTVDWRTAQGSASNLFDYIDGSGTLLWPAGDRSPRTFDVTLLNDSLVEAEEQFSVEILNPTGGAILGRPTSATVTIADDDVGPGFLSFTAAGYQVEENATNAVITVGRLFGRSGVVSARVSTMPGGTAVAGIDYVATNVPVVFLDGETNKPILIPVLNNFIAEGNKSIQLQLSEPTGGASTNGQIIAAVLTLLDDEQPAGSTDAGFGALGPNAQVNVVVVQTNNNKLWVGGDFTLFNGLPRNHLVRLNQSGSVDTTFDSGTLLSNSVRALAVQPDGKVLVGGLFTNLNNTFISYLTRLGVDGSQDTNFLSGLSGANNVVHAIALQPDNRILIGGAFSSVNGVARGRLARLEANGTVDLSFSTGVSADGDVHAIAVLPDGRVVIGGDFLAIGGVPRPRIARLNANGTVDSTFAPGTGFDASVRSLVLQADGAILVGGYFTNCDNQVRRGVARLLPGGGLDSSFNPGLGANEYVSSLALQPDGRVLVAGGFTDFNGLSRGRLVRLNQDGSVDFTINLGTGADNYINTVALQTDRKILIGGGFRSFDGVPRNYIARLAGGENYGAGEFAFSAGSYLTLENASNLTVTVERRIGGSNAVSVSYATIDGSALGGSHYLTATGVLHFAAGESRASFTLATLNDLATNADRSFRVVLSEPQGGARLGAPAETAVTIANDDCVLGFEASFYTAAESQGSNVLIRLTRSGSTVGTVTVDFAAGPGGTATPAVDYLAQALQVVFTNGQSEALASVPLLDDSVVEPNETVALRLLNQASTAPADNVSVDAPDAILSIVDDDFSSGLIGFSQAGFVVSEQAGQATITLVRLGGSAGAASVAYTTGPGPANSATEGSGFDYLGVSGIISFADGQSAKSFTVPILDDILVEGPEQIRITLSNPVGTLLATNTTILTIAADEALFNFAGAVLTVDETNGQAVITVFRSPEGTGPVSVDFATVDGSALAGADYGATNGTLTFAPGQLTSFFVIPIVDDGLGEGDEFLSLVLSNPGGEASLVGVTNVASLFIIDNDISYSFPTNGLIVLESQGSLRVPVARTGRTNGVAAVDFNTSDGTATAGQDYVFTSQRLVFADGETLQFVTVPILNDTVGEGDETVTLNLVNPTNGTSLGVPSTGFFTIVDDEDTLRFESASYSVPESATNVVVTVRRSDYAVGTVSVQCVVVPGTATAGSDYTNVSQQLTFGANEFSKTITVPIVSDQLLEGDETFTLLLTNATGGTTLIQPRSTVVTILEDDVSLAFSSATYAVRENETNAVITVRRLGGTAGLSTVTLVTQSGSASAGLDYVPTNAILRFLPGEASVTFLLPILDDLLIEGDETVTLSLRNPSPGVSLSSPSNAVLTIVDDDASILVAAGAALLSESLSPANGLIDPTETVTVNLGLRNVGNVDTANLIATLLNSNGVTLASGPQNYGAVVAGGAVVSRAFSFTAAGAVGQRITASLRLQDGANFLGVVNFEFTLGRPTQSFTNVAGITIRDRSVNSGTALPYPSSIAVSGFAGTVNRLTVTLHNLSHTFPDDLDILLVSPTGEKCLLMSDAGSSSSSANPVSNVTLTFDEAAATTIPDSNQIVSATYRPANWFGLGSADFFPSPAPGGPYTNASLAVFNGVNPNGAWSLYVVDDEIGDAGNIAGGWSLSITTTEPIPALADLSVAAVDSPDPLPAGSLLTYTITVYNHGPSTATGVVLTNLLPPGMIFFSASASSGSCAQSSNIVACTLNPLASGGTATVTLSGAPTFPGTLTDTVLVRAAQADVNLGNNQATIKTSVQALALRLAHQAGGCVLRWPAPATGYTLEYASALNASTWLPYGGTPTVVNGENVLTVTMTNGWRFFRLRAPAP